MEEENAQVITERQEGDLTKQYDEVQMQPKIERTDSFYDGKLLEIIGYRILSFLITLVSFGIASAWGEKLLIAYDVEHTVYNGKRLKFNGTGASLFVQKFKWIFFSIITLGIYALWIPVKKQKWIASNTYFENEPYTKGDSCFTGGLLGLIGVNLFCKLLTLISFGILYPFGICYKQRWIAKHTVINRKKIIFDGKAVSLIGHYLLWWFLCIITFGIYALWLPINITKWYTKNIHIKLKDEEEPKLSVAPAILGVLLAVIIIASISANFSKIYEGFNDENSKFNIERFFNDLSKNINEEKTNKNNSYIAIIDKNENDKTTNKNEDKNESKKDTSKNTSTNTSSYGTKDFHRDTTLTLVDGVLCYGYSNHSSDLVAKIDNEDIIISQGNNKAVIKNTNAKYMYCIAMYAADVVDLYYITNSNELYVIYSPNATNQNQKKVKLSTSKSVTEFLGTTSKNDGLYIKLLCEDGSAEEIRYLKY